jgi:hypothetical protein
LFVWLLIASGCSSKRTQEAQIPAEENILDVETLRHLLGKELSVVKNAAYDPSVLVSDTTFESEDGESWPGLVFYYNNKRAFFAETNWKRKQTISRIIIVANDITTLSGITVGNKFRDISDKLSKHIPSYPDGYLGLRDLNNPGVTYFFYLNANSKEAFGDITFDSIPGNLEVTQILMEDIR